MREGGREERREEQEDRTSIRSQKMPLKELKLKWRSEEKVGVSWVKRGRKSISGTGNRLDKGQGFWPSVLLADRRKDKFPSQPILSSCVTLAKLIGEKRSSFSPCFFSLLHPQAPNQRVAHRRCSRNICGLSKPFKVLSALVYLRVKWAK